MHTIRLKHVDAAVRDSEFSRVPRPWLRAPTARWIAVALVAAAGAGAYALTRPADDLRPYPPITSTAESVFGPQGASAPVGTGTPSAEAKASRTSADMQASRVVVSSQNILEQRLAATEEWLASADSNALTIQLMEAEFETQLARDLSELSSFIEINEVFLYRTHANRRTALSVLYGSFSDRRSAQEALDKLPAALSANRPFLRTVRGVRNEASKYRGRATSGTRVGTQNNG
jgi:DamX protein